MDGGAWQAAVHGVAEGQTRLSDFTFTFSSRKREKDLEGSEKMCAWHREWAFLVAQMVKNLAAMQETQVLSLDQEDPLEKEMATHSSILAWEIPWTEEPCGQQTMVSQSQT